MRPPFYFAFPWWDKTSKVLSSGIVFILLGIGFLYVASTYMGSEHSTFSFVLVTLGTAIILYGTGTQGMGAFKSDSSTAAKLNVAIAGGAGVLAFCVAYGMIHYQEPMKTAFQIEHKYFVVRVGTKDDASTKFDGYSAQFSIDGLEIPAMKRGKFYLVYVPYLEKDKSQTRNIDISFNFVGPGKPKPGLSVTKEERFPVTIESARFPITDAGSDFPMYLDIHFVDLQEPVGFSLANAGQAAPANVKTEPPTAPPPVRLLPESKV